MSYTPLFLSAPPLYEATTQFKYIYGIGRGGAGETHGRATAKNFLLCLPSQFPVFYIQKRLMNRRKTHRDATTTSVLIEWIEWIDVDVKRRLGSLPFSLPFPPPRDLWLDRIYIRQGQFKNEVFIIGRPSQNAETHETRI